MYEQRTTRIFSFVSVALFSFSSPAGRARGVIARFRVPINNIVTVLYKTAVSDTATCAAVALERPKKKKAEKKKHQNHVRKINRTRAVE